MKILYVNWAPLWRGSEVGGGVNVYVRALAREFAARGHRVDAVNAGYSYDLLWLPRIRRATLDQGVHCHEIVNSPVLAPGYFNAARPLTDVREPRIEQCFAGLLRRLQPEVVHFHNIEGFSGRCIELARIHGARVIYSLHNYHPLCSQVNLLYRHNSPCEDYRDGHRCLDCLTPPSRWRHLLRRRLLHYLRDLPFIRNLRRSHGSILASALPVSAAGQFRDRRRQLVACLNQADRLLAVSSWVRDVYVGQGLNPEKVTVKTIGSAIAELGRRQPARPPRSDNAPLRLVFLGVAEPHKGLPLLLDALTGMDDTELGRIDLALYARGAPALADRLARLQPRLARLTVRDGYRYDTIPELLADRDLGVVAPIWWDNAPQVVFELLALGVPVLGARIGGIPDFVEDGGNGLLFEPGDATALGACLRRVLADPGLPARLRAGIRPMKTIAEHADELETLYSGCGD